MAAANLNIFLTAYDPSDLPGGSIDPMGFESGYLFLADQLLPDLTNVASRPRYFGVLCASICITPVDSGDSPRVQYAKRLECALRLERFWALANVLATRGNSNGELPANSIRGITYAEAKASNVLEKNHQFVGADFPFLASQVRYGMVGIYGAVADRLRIIDRKTMALTPDLGERLGSAFIKETQMPSEVKSAVRDSGKVAAKALESWGRRSHIAGKTGRDESQCILEAFHYNGLRSRMGELLLRFPYKDVHETELSRLARIFRAVKSDAAYKDLCQAMVVILNYERCYAQVLLAFERVLWLCRSLVSVGLSSTDISTDGVLKGVCQTLPKDLAQFHASLGEVSAPMFKEGLSRLESVRAFLERLSRVCSSPSDLVAALLTQHTEVQSGKFDNGRRKSPWIETRDGKLSLAYTQVGGRTRELKDANEIVPHYYRTQAADEMLAVGASK